MLLDQFLEEKLKKLLSEKYHIPEEQLNDKGQLEKALKELQEAHDKKFKWHKGSAMGGSLDTHLKFLTEDEVEEREKRVNAFLSRFSNS